MIDEIVDTPSAILASAALLLRQRTFEDISYLDLAEATGVSERTIYRRFPTRSHLLEALAHWIEAEHFPDLEFRSADELRAAVRARFALYEAEPAFALVAARGSALSPTGQESAAPLTEAIMAMIRATAPSLNRRDAQRAAASIRCFTSPIFWARMRTGFEMGAEETFQVFDLALRRVLPASAEANRAA